MSPRDAIGRMLEIEFSCGGDEESLHAALDELILELLEESGDDMWAVANQYKQIRERAAWWAYA